MSCLKFSEKMGAQNAIKTCSAVPSTFSIKLGFIDEFFCTGRAKASEAALRPISGAETMNSDTYSHAWSGQSALYEATVLHQLREIGSEGLVIAGIK